MFQYEAFPPIFDYSIYIINWYFFIYCLRGPRPKFLSLCHNSLKAEIISFFPCSGLKCSRAHSGFSIVAFNRFISLHYIVALITISVVLQLGVHVCVLPTGL